MSVHMGIMCEKCHRVHFIATSSGIKPMLCMLFPADSAPKEENSERKRCARTASQMKCSALATQMKVSTLLFLPHRTGRHRNDGFRGVTTSTWSEDPDRNLI